MPAGQAEHEPLHTDETKPGSQDLHTEAPTPENVLTAQLVHVLSPAVAAMVPAAQAVQALLPGTEVKPAGHRKHEPGTTVPAVVVLPETV